MARTTTELPELEPHSGGATHPVLVLAFPDGGRGAPERFAIPPGGLLLGRDAPVFSGGLEDDSLSRSHAEIRPGPSGLRIHDLGSRNGTWVNAKRVDGAQPLHPGDVVRVGARLLVYARASDDEVEGAAVAPELVGESDAMAGVRRAIALVAGQRRSVLVLGETGTGKELVARALHDQSGRTGRFVGVNCGALSEELLTSELFGHVRGAFTGAVGDQTGLFRAAHKGTLFLDELGEMPRDLQPKLLRALELGQVRPVGGTAEIAVDVAVVGATHRDLVSAVREGRFRADLYARLAQWIIPLPSLASRREDIPALVQRLLARCDAAGRSLTLPFAEALLLHPWPLNVRGLANVLSIAALATPRGAPLGLYPEVVAALEATQAITGAEAAAGGEAALGEGEGGDAARVERTSGVPSAEALERALEQSEGSVADAARRLGGSRQQLYRWLDARGVSLARFRDRGAR